MSDDVDTGAVHEMARGLAQQLKDKGLDAVIASAVLATALDLVTSGAEVHPPEAKAAFRKDTLRLVEQLLEFEGGWQEGDRP